MKSFFTAITIATAPLWLPLGIPCIFPVVADGWRLLRFGTFYVEPELTPINSLTLEQSVQDWFLEETAALFSFNFRLVTDCIFRSEPIRIVSRYLLSDDQKTIAILDACHPDTEVEEHTYSLISVNDDGTYFESCNVDEDIYDERPQAEDQVVLTMVGRVSFAELLSRHEQAVEAAGTPLLAWAPDQVLEVSRYGYRKVEAWKFRIGKIKTGPPAAELPPYIAGAGETLEVECLQTV
jgi:hypothetical protein